ncbi:MAG: hypothetical protein ACTHMJ_04865 [Thermomicrobiales bacterium]|nr:hypothetical protein [Thermomicrobiales bacterium]
MDVRAGRRRHTIRRMCAQGDTSVSWETGAGVETDEEAQAAIREAERIFHEALTHGDVPFAIERGQAPQKLDRWDIRAQEADEIVIAPRLMGG